MDTVFDKLHGEIIGHQFEPDIVNKRMVCRNPEHRGEWSTTCWKAKVGEWIGENTNSNVYENSLDDHAQDMVTLIDKGAVLVKYTFIASALDPRGHLTTYTSTTNNLGIEDELGMVEYLKLKLTDKMFGRG